MAGVNFPLGSLHTQTRTVKQNCTVAVYFVRCSASEKHRILYSFRCFWKWIWCPIDKLLEDRNLSLFFSSLGLDCAHLCVWCQSLFILHAEVSRRGLFLIAVFLESRRLLSHHVTLANTLFHFPLRFFDCGVRG